MGQSQLESTLHPITRNVWNYGLGWDSVKDLSLAAVGARAWVKGGDTADYHAGLVVAPEAGLAVFVAGAGTFSSGAAQAVAEEILLNALAERGDIPAVPQQLGTDQPPAMAPTEDDINAMVGIYLGTPSLALRIVRAAGETLGLERLSGGVWFPSPWTMSFRADGAWWPDAARAQSLRAVTGWGRSYVVIAAPDGYGNSYGEQILAERVAPAGPIAPAWRSRLGEWLSVNDVPTATWWLNSPITVISAIPGLPGYLDVAGMSAVDARQPRLGAMFLQVPLMMGRDLDDLIAVRPGVVRMGSSVMVERDRVPALAIGRSAVRIGSQGYAEWREVVSAGRIAISDAQAWFLYDEDVSLLRHGTSDATGVRAPAGSLLVVFGEPGTVVTLAGSSP